MFDDPFENPHKALEEIASGTSSFGPTDEWTDWYHYLLAWLIPHNQETHALHALLEMLVTLFYHPAS